MATSCMSHIPQSSKGYSRLVELIKLAEREEPLFVFNDFEEDIDGECYRISLDYFNDHADLIRKMQKDLGGGELRWRIDSFKHRLLFVPEQRAEYATLFQNYCNEVIDYTLDKTKVDNPYEKIQTLLLERPDIPDRGMTVFLVHNLAREFNATFSFFNPKKAAPITTIKLSGKVFTGIVGSYTTNIYIRENGTFKFVEDNYTIWQNCTKNPYTVLMVPIEETLHIALREQSHREIEEQIVLNSVTSKGKMEKIVKDWMAVEEAVVGGLVHALLPHFVKNHVNNLPYSLIEEDIKSKCELERYCYLEKGIEVVKTMGYKEVIKMYKNSPMQLKKLLTQPSFKSPPSIFHGTSSRD